MAKRFKPSVRSICVIGTLAHNRSFKGSEIREYLRFEGRPFDPSQTMAWLKEHKHIKSVGPGRWAPTAKGWKMIEKACKR